MKLRLETDTIKLRLSPEEMDALSKEKHLIESFLINSVNKFDYSIRIVDGSETCQLQFSNASINIFIPTKKVEKWFNSHQVGIREEIVTENNGIIVLVIEEDLPPKQKHKNQKSNAAS